VFCVSFQQFSIVAYHWVFTMFYHHKKKGFSLLAKGFSIHDSAIAVTTQPALVVALHPQAAQAARVASLRLAGWASRPASLAMSRKMCG